MSERPLAQELQSLSDAALTALVRQGPRSGDSFLAVAELFARHWASVYRYAALCTHRPAATTVLAKEAFLHAQREARSSEEAAFAWRPTLLATVLARACVWAQGNRRPELSAKLLAWLDEPDNVRTGMEGGPLSSLARQAFLELPEQSQCLLWHSVVEVDPPAVVGRLTGLDEQVAARHLARARQLFREACVQAHLTSTLDRQCLAYGSLLDAATRTEASDQGPSDLQWHLAGCAHCRATAHELSQHGDRLALILAHGLLAWGVEPYLNDGGRQAPEGDTARLPRRPQAAPRTRVRPGTVAIAVGGIAVALATVSAAVVRFVPDTSSHAAEPPYSYTQHSSTRKPDEDSVTSRPSTDGFRTVLRNAATRQCLDVRDGTLVPKVDVVSTRCTSAARQQWIFGDDSRVHNAADTGLCLDATGYGTLQVRACPRNPGEGAAGLHLVWNTKGEITTSASPHLLLTTPEHARNRTDIVVLKARDGSRAQTWVHRPPVASPGRTPSPGLSIIGRAEESGPSDSAEPSLQSTNPVSASHVPKAPKRHSSSRRPSTPASSPSSSLNLSTRAVSYGDTYTATVRAFSPGESVRLSWRYEDPSRADQFSACDQVIGTRAADSAGTAVFHVAERVAQAGVEFIICAEGLQSGRTATARLTVSS
ncbi:ricin-type beta-trefoil lectin domain protein [Streptomyces sp. NPDC005728]|uniref:ricin-type beta-trefoil lectin domain protein n=1 Tax=Streptomyces sp. NPDC005728 TaxID=3157054 RepID=UPI0033E2249A